MRKNYGIPSEYIPSAWSALLLVLTGSQARGAVH